MASRAVGRTDNFEWVKAKMTWGCEAQKQGLQTATAGDLVDKE
jgi:hypothetical protein